MRWAALLTLAALGCNAGPDLNGPPGSDAPEVRHQASTIVDDLAQSEVPPWTKKVRGLEDPLRVAVYRELGRRTIEAGEAVAQDQEPKEFEAVRVLFSEPDGGLYGFADYLVWDSMHRGRQGFRNIWPVGVKLFPSVLKVRKDRHHSASKSVGYVIAEYAIGSFRGNAHNDATIVTFCTEELTRCPPDLRPHYRAILAALGDRSALEAFPTLLNSELPADWRYAHEFLRRMVRDAGPYEGREYSGITGEDVTPERGNPLWRPFNAKVLSWFESHLNRMTYDRNSGWWNPDGN